jgi:hypothetical protein
MSILLITGQATSGKSSLGAYLEQCNLAITVSGDAHRFVPGKGWAKRSTEDYVRSVEEAIHAIMTAHPGRLIALETTVEDVSDPEDARKVCALKLCERGLVRQVLVLEMDKDRYLLGVMTRSMRRARGAEPQNPVCDETPLAVLRLVAKAWKSAEGPMQPFLVAAQAMGVPIAQCPAVPLPEPWDRDLCAKETLTPTVSFLQTLPSLRGHLQAGGKED